MASGNESHAHRASGSRVSDDDAARQLLTTCLSKSWSNPRKRPGVSSSSDPSYPAQHDLSLYEAVNTTDQPHKRSRAGDWPLKPTNVSNPSSVTPRRAHKSPLSPVQRHNMFIRPRPSKFLEGSMNDRVSARPPSIYTRDEAAMEQYHSHNLARGSGSLDSQGEDDKSYLDTGIETGKQSGMYRFGKALVSAFNPVNVWQGINGIWKDKEQENQNTTVLQERKIRADKKYAEMKQSGFKMTRSSLNETPSLDESHRTSRDSQSDLLDSSVHPPSITFDQARPSTTFKHGRPTPTGSEDLLIPPPTPMEHPYLANPSARGEDGHRASLNIRRPSFQSLKKVKSHIQLPSTKRKVADAALLSPNSGITSKQMDVQALRRQPSKKDVAKRQKLSKQVSNLESKLEAVRRELELCNAETPDIPKIPGSPRKAFVPGALSSLPSESNFKSTNLITRDESDAHWQPPYPRRTYNQTSTPRKLAIEPPTGTSSNAAAKAQAKGPENSGKKRKLSNDRNSSSSHIPRDDVDHGFDSDSSVSAKKILRAHKSQRLDEPWAKLGIEARIERSPATVSRSPRQSKPKTQASIPPVPSLAASFDPSQIDKSKMLAMRSIPKDDLPFGAHLDDIVNLQKTFPLCNQKQLNEYLLSLSEDYETEGKIKNLENQQPNSPSRTSSISASPVKPSTTQDAQTRNRPACKNSSPNKKIGRELSTINEAITVDPSKDKSIPPLPSILKLKTQGMETRDVSTRPCTEKPLPDIQKEDYAWPEDVF